ncbi:MAG TPA: lysophospholipid acyltransferase family protein [Candidatus Limnocylindrales bacterium]|nr:lysophospholipid acyltransferase family protein [Candidatus Limnocylindrales bacterium]
MTLLNGLQLLFIGLLTLVFGVPGILLALLLPGRTLKGKVFLRVSKYYSRIALFVMGVKVASRGIENIDSRKPYVFMSNHVSHADSPALAAVIPHPLHWVFKKELSKIPVFGWVLLACGQIMVDRSDPEKSKAALREALSGLSGNNSVMIYPEGTRSRDGNLQPLKKGGFRMALEAGLPIVPVRVSGTREVVAAGTLRIRPGNVLVELFPPIPTAGKGMADLPELMQRVREAMLSGRRGPA